MSTFGRPFDVPKELGVLQAAGFEVEVSAGRLVAAYKALVGDDGANDYVVMIHVPKGDDPHPGPFAVSLFLRRARLVCFRAADLRSALVQTRLFECLVTLHLAP
jgi:hypothetical protein